MKTDLFTSIVIAIVGAVGGGLVTNMLLGPIESTTVKTIEEHVSADLAEPDPEVFNYRALNPTVEVYVGDCDEYNEFGECVEPETQSSTDALQQEGK